MKRLALLLIIFATMSASAQDFWTGTKNTTSNIYRDGFIGIGTSPSYPIHIAPSSSYDAAVYLKRAANTKRNVFFFVPNGGITTSNVLWSNGMLVSDNSYTISYFDGSATVKALTVRNDGNVGIGNASPAELLSVKSSSGNDATLGIQRSNNADRAMISYIPNGAYSSSNVMWTMGMLQNENNFTFSYYDGTSTTKAFTVTNSGEVGIGTTTPGTALEVNGTVTATAFVGDGSGLTGLAGGGLWTDDDGYNYANNATNVVVTDAGRVGIGTTSPSVSLGVVGDCHIDGKIEAEEIEVVASVTPDFVFEKDYNLRSLNDVETFIKNNKHLPEIPSAKEMKEEGIKVGEMQGKLLQKVEELTLYMIQQKKALEEAKKEIEILKAQNQKLMEKAK